MKHTTRLTACLLALALTACTAAPQDMPASTTTETAAAPAQTAEPTTETPAVQDTLAPIYTTWGAAVGQDAVYSAICRRSAKTALLPRRRARCPEFS